MVKDPVNTIWMGLEYFCNENDDFWNMEDKNIVSMAKDELSRMKFFEGKVLDSVVIRVKKAYPAYFDSYNEIDKVISYLNSINNLYCIGRNGQHRYNNMDHSMETAIIAAKSILNNDLELKKQQLFC